VTLLIPLGPPADARIIADTYIYPRPANRSAGYDGSIATKRTPSRRDRALATLKASDRKLARLIDATEPVDTKAWRKARPLGDPFSVLVYSIIGQQISGYAAQAIAGRLQECFGGRMPSPAELLTLDAVDFRAIGFSGRKVEYVRSLAEHIISGELQVDHLDKLSDDEVRDQITASRGLGRWTADMFLLINLERSDILPIGDLGIRSSVQRLYRLDHLPSPREVDAIGEKWRPNRSLASLYLWASSRAAPKPAKRTPIVAAR
jgi:DNA-3-methyladenine glycosylase II